MEHASTPEHVLRLSGALTVASADGLHATLLDALQAHPCVVLDCSEAHAFDVAFVQLLLAAQDYANRHRLRFGLAEPVPPGLGAVLHRGGFRLDRRDGGGSSGSSPRAGEGT